MSDAKAVMREMIVAQITKGTRLVAEGQAVSGSGEARAYRCWAGQCRHPRRAVSGVWSSGDQLLVHLVCGHHLHWTPPAASRPQCHACPEER